MRRTDRQVKDFSEICAILDKCQVMRLGLCDGQRPYVVPVNFGYEVRQGQIWLYFHCANQGRKLDMLKRNPSVCFEMDCEHDLVLDPTPCACGYRFASVIGEGGGNTDRPSGQGPRSVGADAPPDRQAGGFYAGANGGGMRVPHRSRHIYRQKKGIKKLGLPKWQARALGYSCS